MEDVKEMQRDLVAQLWSNHGRVRLALQSGSPQPLSSELLGGGFSQ